MFQVSVTVHFIKRCSIHKSMYFDFEKFFFLRRCYSNRSEIFYEHSDMADRDVSALQSVEWHVDRLSLTKLPKYWSTWHVDRQKKVTGDMSTHHPHWLGDMSTIVLMWSEARNTLERARVRKALNRLCAPVWMVPGTPCPGMCTCELLGYIRYQVMSNTWYLVYTVPGKSGYRVPEGG